MQTDFALRVLLYLAHRQQQASVDEIAKAYAISREHLFKVVQQLVRFGFIVSRSGRGGGVRLVMAPEKISVADVVAKFEGRNGALRCVNDPHDCILEPGCSLRTLLIRAEQAFYDTLAPSIADVIAANTNSRSGGVYNLIIKRSSTTTIQGETDLASLGPEREVQ